MKYLSIDIETTGIGRPKCDIIEFGAIFDDLRNQRPIASLPRFHCYFLPPEGETYCGEPYALSMHPLIFRRIADREKPYDYVSPRKFGFRFKQFLLSCGYILEKDSITINAAGKNFAAFDLQFLDEKTDLSKHVGIRHRIIDPSILYIKKDDEALPGTKECKERRKLLTGDTATAEVSHTAIDDAIDVINLVRTGLSHIYG